MKKYYILGVVFFAAIFYFQPAQANCYITDKGDYICDGSTGGPQDVGNTTPPPPPPPPNGGSTTPPPVKPPVFLPNDATCSGGSDYNAFKKHLASREGYKTTVYLDSLGKPTVGVGHLVTAADNLKVGDKVTDAQVQAWLDKDAQAAWNAAQSQASGAGIGSACFGVALGSVNYQLGTGWRTKFPNTWALIQQGKYAEAAAALNGTIWQKQTPVRVKDFQDALMALDAAKKKAAAAAGTAP